MKKIILWAGLIVAAVIGGVIIYLLIFRSDKTPAPAVVVTPDKISEVQLTQVLENEVQFPALALDQQTVFYFNRQKNPGIFEYNFKIGTVKQLAEFDDISDITWSPDRQWAIFQIIYDKERFEKYQSPFLITDVPEAADGTVTNWLYNFRTGKLRKLDQRVNNPKWSSNSNKILYLSVEPETDQETINIIDITNNQIRTIPHQHPFDLIETDFISENEIYYLPLRNEYDLKGSNIYRINLTTQKETVIIEDETRGRVLTSPQKNYLVLEIFGEDESGQTGLAVLNLNSGEETVFEIKSNINQISWADDESFLIASVSQDNRSDKVYKIDIGNEQITELRFIRLDNLTLKIENLMISQSGKRFFFTSAKILYRADFL